MGVRMGVMPDVGVGPRADDGDTRQHELLGPQPQTGET